MGATFDLSEESLFSLWRVDSQEKGAGFHLAIGLVAVVLLWMIGLGFLGGFRRNDVAAFLFALAPASAWIAAGGVGLGLFCLLAVVRRDAGLGLLGAMGLAFLVGHLMYSHFLARYYIRGTYGFDDAMDGFPFAANRLLYTAAVTAPMVVVALFFPQARQTWGLGLGGWSRATRIMSRREPLKPWGGQLLGVAATAGILTLVLQSTVGFQPVRSGLIVTALPAVLVAAVVNAAVEELLFRGLLQPTFVAFLGLGRGLWVQGLLFGLFHWGISVGVLAALPTSLAIGLGSVAFGKSVAETRGLSWAVAAHALFDVAVFAAYFVRPAS